MAQTTSDSHPHSHHATTIPCSGAACCASLVRPRPVQEKPIVLSLGKKVRRRISDRYAVARKNVWQVLDQSPAAWRVNGGTGKNTNTNPCPCKAPRNRWYPLPNNPQLARLRGPCLS